MDVACYDELEERASHPNAPPLVIKWDLVLVDRNGIIMLLNLRELVGER